MTRADELLTRPAQAAVREAAQVTSGSRLAARYANMAESFIEVVRTQPERPAIVQGDLVLTYAQADDVVSRLANTLVSRGVLPGHAVAYLLPNCPELVELFYAIQRIGAVAVPINIRSIPREIAYFLRASESVCLVFASVFAEQVGQAREILAASEAGLRPTLLCLDGPLHADDDRTTPPCPAWSVSLTAATAGASPVPPPLVRDAEAVARIQFTGGSTGAPKGVERTHHADLVNAEGTYLSNGLYADDRKVVLIQCPLEHHGGHAWFTMAVAVGATLVLCSTFDAEEILRQIERRGVSYLILLPPSTLARLLRHPTISTTDTSSVRLVQSSAGATTAAIVRDVYRHFPLAVMNYGWGQTESGLGASHVITSQMVADGDPRVRSIGRPMPFTELRVVDEDGVDVPDGGIGQCLVRSAAVMSGYHEQPALTQSVLPGDGWLRTGDLMVRDGDGYYYLCSRSRDLIKSGGENVFTGEVEDVVRAHPGVADCVVYGVPDERLGEAVAVAVEPVPGSHLELAELQEHCRRRLASYKKPRQLEILTSLDRDDSGKVDKTRVVRTCEIAAAQRVAEIHAPDPLAVCEQVSDVPRVVRIALPTATGDDRSIERETACYLLIGKHRSVLVDTGSDSTLGLGLLTRALEALDVRIADLDVILTHEHPDHTGLARYASGGRARLMAGAGALDHMRATAEYTTRTVVRERWELEGFGDAQELVLAGVRSCPDEAIRLGALPLADGDRLPWDDAIVEVLATPGHTPGSICLYLPEHQILLSGDHVLPHVSPPLCAPPLGCLEHGDTAQKPWAAQYLDSLNRVAELDVRLWLPAHGPWGEDLAARARSLVTHHEARLELLVRLVTERDGPAAVDLVPHLGWRLDGGISWHEASPGLRWLTAVQTLAYLDLLCHSGVLSRERTGRGRSQRLRYRAGADSESLTTLTVKERHGLPTD